MHVSDKSLKLILMTISHSVPARRDCTLQTNTMKILVKVYIYLFLPTCMNLFNVSCLTHTFPQAVRNRLCEV